MSGLAAAPVVGFIPVSDLEKAKAFFGGKLGLKVTGSDGFALMLEAAGGVKIRCVLTADAKPQPFTILGWEVADVHATLAELMEAGVKPIVYPHMEQDEAGVWTAPGGSEVAWFHDPDGNVLSLTRHAAAKGDGGSGAR